MPSSGLTLETIVELHWDCSQWEASLRKWRMRWKLACRAERSYSFFIHFHLQTPHSALASVVIVQLDLDCPHRPTALGKWKMRLKAEARRKEDSGQLSILASHTLRCSVMLVTSQEPWHQRTVGNAQDPLIIHYTRPHFDVVPWSSSAT